MEWADESDFVEIAEKFRRLKDIPRFISLEGPEGAGKTTQARLLSRFLRKLGYRTIVVKDPGTTPLGERIRKMLKSVSLEIDDVSELFLFLAARRQLVVEVIKPALRQGKVVIADRFTHSTLAYQGKAKGIMPETLPMLCYIATGGVEPEMTIVLDIEPEKGLERAKKRYDDEDTANKEKIEYKKKHYDKKDRFESQNIDFHKRLREYYIELAQREPNVFVVNADMEPHEVLKSILKKIYNFAMERQK